MSGRETAPGIPEQSPAPRLRIVRGDLAPEETAALVAVLTARARAARAAAGAAEEPAPRSAWRDRSRLVRRPLHPGPGAWRMSLRSG
ncbi:acyl-CoA carboxylase subunit epsilon [Spinactinospora alkalitolerans]|uniref:acyl-CoA carboxylase subunit epsilon n=1 Tax=Spinactinospora alkalitolerans TaxID=687207 RepID=UPI0015CB37DF|nr:acyl-CoA carboxylase subunit epsilon [Spinactinospora alkalitolerans]